MPFFTLSYTLSERYRKGLFGNSEKSDFCLKYSIFGDFQIGLEILIKVKKCRYLNTKVLS